MKDEINSAGKIPKSLSINVNTTRLKTISSMTGAKKIDIAIINIFPPTVAESKNDAIGGKGLSPK